MKKLIVTLILTFIPILIYPQPKTITYQGKLLDNTGLPINQSNVMISFAIFDATSGGNKIWPLGSEYVSKTVNIKSGLYSVSLGTGIMSYEIFVPTNFIDKTPYLEVKIGSSTLPRTELPTVAFALISDIASKSTNLLGGSAGSLPYQSAEDITSMLPIGANGKVLTLIAGIPSWQYPIATDITKPGNIKIQSTANNGNILFSTHGTGSVSIKSSGTPDSTSILDINSQTKGVLVPRMTTEKRNNISSPADGLLLYQLDSTSGFAYNSNNGITSSWKRVLSSDDPVHKAFGGKLLSNILIYQTIQTSSGSETYAKSYLTVSVPNVDKIILEYGYIDSSFNALGIQIDISQPYRLEIYKVFNTNRYPSDKSYKIKVDIYENDNLLFNDIEVSPEVPIYYKNSNRKWLVKLIDKSKISIVTSQIYDLNNDCRKTDFSVKKISSVAYMPYAYFREIYGNQGQLMVEVKNQGSMTNTYGISLRSPQHDFGIGNVAWITLAPQETKQLTINFTVPERFKNYIFSSSWWIDLIDSDGTLFDSVQVYIDKY